MKNEIIVLFEGYSYDDPENSQTIMRANCTSSLIKTEIGRNILVDTLTPWDSQKLLKALEKNSTSPDNINTVVCTHGHSDHTGNNNLFPNLEWLIVGNCVSHGDKYLKRNLNVEPFRLTDSIEVIGTLGHTNSCVSVIVKNSNLGSCVGICGDLFERQEDVDNKSLWLQTGSENPEEQSKNRLRISQLVDLIIPGHGKPFKVDEEYRQKLQAQDAEIKKLFSKD